MQLKTSDNDTSGVKNNARDDQSTKRTNYVGYAPLK